MAALVQAFPQQAGTVTMLQTRPASAGGMLPAQSQSPSPYVVMQQQQQQQQRHSYYGNPNTMGGGPPVLYRSATAPIQPYAFTSTPSLNTAHSWQQQAQQQQQQQQQQQYAQQTAMRSSSTTPSLPRMQSFDGTGSLARISRQQASASMVNLSAASAAPTVRYVGSRDDSSIPGQGTRRVAATPRPQSAYLTGSAPQLSFTQATPVRPSPERYRRAGAAGGSGGQQPKPASQAQGSAAPSGSGIASVGRFYAPNGDNNSSLPDQQQKSAVPRSHSHNQLGDPRRNSFHDTILSGQAADDIHLHRHSNSDDAKRFRRRSMPSLNAADFTPDFAQNASRPLDKDVQSTPSTVMHNKDGSSESVASSLSSSSRPSSTNRNTAPSVSTASSAGPVGPSQADRDTDKNKEPLRLVNIPPRTSSSKPAKMDGADASETKADNAAVVSSPAANAGPGSSNGESAGMPSHLESPAMRHLSAISQKGGRLRSKTSKLRRAFSFGSAADFRSPSGTATEEGGSVGATNKLQKEPTGQELYDAEQARIAQQQEEGGIGSSIYAGARIFSGSTDNLSISSTASSASIMIRKMGRGMKKSTRSLVGLFRPKSIVGASADDDGLPDANTATAGSRSATEATVSMVTVEAERERVNVNPDVHSQSGGGTGFPRLERNSIDASRTSLASDRLGSSGTDNSAPRKSILEGDKERAEVLAAVRKGILKNTSGSSSPSRAALDIRHPLSELHNPPAISESPASSAPSTPNDEIQGHKRSGSVAIGGEDYFVSALRLRGDSKSDNSTPQGSMKRCATFSPRIIFYDTWPSQEYDRRGEIATCNRLTPMLAQQIKEELNSFKMEMEVHENSKIYTHFF